MNELGVAAVVADPGNLQLHTCYEIAAAARLTLPTVAAMPSDSHPVAGLPWIGIFSDRIDHPRDFMPGSAWINDSGKAALLGQHVAMADAACLNSDSHRSTDRLPHPLIHQLETSARATHTYYFHRATST
jgi:hypothetical protein